MLRPRGVADAGRAVAHDEDHGVAHILEVLHLAQEHGMPEVEVGRGRVEADLDLQRPARRDALAELFLPDDLHEALFQVCDLFVYRMQSHLIIVAAKAARRRSTGR